MRALGVVTPSERAFALGSRVQVIHHSADYDGLFSRAVFERFAEHMDGLPHDLGLKFVPWDFGDPVPELDPGATSIVVVDLPFDVNPALTGDPRLVWIDHHRSSIARAPSGIAGYRVDGVAACRLAWQYVFGPDELPTLDQYLSREVEEPLAIRLAGEYDVWNREDSLAEPFQYGLTIHGSEGLSRYLTDCFDPAETWKACVEGHAAQKWHRLFADDIADKHAYRVMFEGLDCLVLASCHARSSLWFPAAVPDGVEALLTWRAGPGDEVHVSMYHAPGREDLDLSLVASKYGGGGHKGACGFILPWVEAMVFFRPQGS